MTAPQPARHTADHRTPTTEDVTAHAVPPLVAAAMAGDADAFAALYRRHLSQVRGVVYRRMHAAARADAEDLVAEVFCKAWANIDKFAWTGADFGAWLVTIAVRTVADYYKSSRRRETASDTVPDNADARPGPCEQWLAAADADRARRVLIAAMPKLTDAQRHCLWLRFIACHNVADTADRLGLSITATKALQYRATQRLRQLCHPATASSRDV